MNPMEWSHRCGHVYLTIAEARCLEHRTVQTMCVSTDHTPWPRGRTDAMCDTCEQWKGVLSAIVDTMRR